MTNTVGNSKVKNRIPNRVYLQSYRNLLKQLCEENHGNAELCAKDLEKCYELKDDESKQVDYAFYLERALRLYSLVQKCRKSIHLVALKVKTLEDRCFEEFKTASFHSTAI
jgi:hypothetical protein